MKSNKEIETIEIYSGTSLDAAFLKTMLEDAGIRAFLKDDNMGTIAPFQVSGGGAGAVKIVINAENYEEANKIVERFEEGRQE
jgi:hypothetical protein